MSGLAGRTVVNTRATHQAAELDALLEARGALPLPYPCIEMAPPEDPAPLDKALRRLAGGEFDWLVVTSANTAVALADRLRFLGLALKPSASLRVAAVGPATAEAVRQQLGLPIAAMPGLYWGEAMIEVIRPAPGLRVLLPQSEIADRTVEDGLRDGGALVTRVDAYRTIIGRGGVELLALLDAGKVDAIAFTSASTVTNFVKRLEAKGGNIDLPAAVCIACIGPKTAYIARDLGLTVEARAVLPAEHTLEGMVDALEAYFSNG